MPTRTQFGALTASLLTAGFLMAGCGGNGPTKNAMPSTPQKNTSTTSSSQGAPSSNSPKASAPAAQAPTSTASPFQKKYLSFDSKNKTVTWQLDGGVPAASSPFNFNGDSSGKMVLTVPKGWSVSVHFKNLGKLPHSAVIVKSKSATQPAFAGASTPTPQNGSPTGAKYTFGFTPTKTGTYYVVCLVPGHVQAGMWDLVKVVASGQPTLKG